MSTENGVPGLEPMGAPIWHFRMIVVCSRCKKDAGYVLADELFKREWAPGESRTNEVREPHYLSYGQSTLVLCPLCSGELAARYLNEHGTEDI